MKIKSIKERKSRFPLSTFWIVLAVMLITSGIHTGLMIVMQTANLAPIVQSHITVFFWIVMAALLTLLIRERMRRVYDMPLQNISEVTKQVAKGDFSVRVHSLYAKKEEDYLDVMVNDLNTMIEELGSIETIKTDFISNVSHEMKTPLSIIKTYAELLRSPDLKVSERMEYAAVIEETAGKMTGLITNILRLNRLENQIIVPEYKEYDLCRQLADCILMFEEHWESRNIEMNVELEDSSLIRADETLLEMVWNNLISNAIKFTDVGGSVAVSQKNENGSLVVSVSDTGCGISEENQKRIFDKFYQGDTSHATEGNGLGLALVQRIVALHDGTITVKSELGKGSTFTVRLKQN